MAWRLEQRLTRRLLATMALLWTVACAATGWAIWRDTRDVLDSALQETAERLMLLPASSWADPDTPARLARAGPHRERVVYQVSLDGALHARSHAAPEQILAPAAADGLIQVPPWRVYTLTSEDGHIRVQVAEPADQRGSVVWAPFGWLLLALLTLLPLAAAVIGWQIRRSFAALEQARQALEHRPRGNLDPVDATGAPAEILPWVGTINTLLERVVSLLAQERSFAADAAHELRAPLAAARAQLQSGLAGADDAQRTQALQAAVLQIDRMTDTCARLLQLARVEAGVALHVDPVDLSELCWLVTDEFRQAHSPDRIRLHEEGPPHRVAADIDALGIALRNLISNALHHGGPEASVVVRVAGWQVSVTDDGPGVPPQRLAGLVRPFVRDGSRRDLLGSGLGLALVDRIARQSGGRLLLASPVADGHGFRASLDFSENGSPRETGPGR